MKERIHWIDIAKGICMISVIAGHLGVSEFGFVYAYHLTTFFILSGYTLRRKTVDRDYLKKIFTRLMVPYFFTCVAVLVMDAANVFLLSRKLTIAGITKTVWSDILRAFYASGSRNQVAAIMDKHIGAIWFLPAMFFALIFTQLLLNAIRSKKRQFVAAIVVAAIGCATAQIVWLPFSIQSAMLAVPFLLFGYYLKETSLPEKLKPWHYIVFFAVFVAGCVAGYAQHFYMVRCAAKNWLITPLCALCASLTVIGLSRWIKKSKVLEFTGRNSQLFLCVHLFESTALSRHFQNLRQLLNLPEHRLIHFGMELIFIYAAVFLLVKLLKRNKRHSPATSVDQRDFGLDILRAMAVVIMVLETAKINEGLLRLINSISVMSLVMVSGFLHKEGLPIRAYAKKLCGLLLAYGAFAVFYIAANHLGTFEEFKAVVLGMSATKELFGGVLPIGPVYCLLLLFAVKSLYICVDRCKNEWGKHSLVLGLFLLGAALGKSGNWLPWSMDCAMFSLLFYHIAHNMRKRNALDTCKKLPWLYFPLSCVWAVMVHRGSMDLVGRQYQNLGITVAGVTAAFLLLYLLCDSLASRLPAAACKAVSVIGRSAAPILVISSAFGDMISYFVASVLELYPGKLPYLIVSLMIRIGLGSIVFLVSQRILPRLRRANSR